VCRFRIRAPFPAARDAAFSMFSLALVLLGVILHRYHFLNGPRWPSHLLPPDGPLTDLPELMRIGFTMNLFAPMRGTKFA
jgi:hypothetical protein